MGDKSVDEILEALYFDGHHTGVQKIIPMEKPGIFKAKTQLRELVMGCLPKPKDEGCTIMCFNECLTETTKAIEEVLE